MSTNKAKKTKPLPTHIHYGVLLVYFATVIILSGGLAVLANFIDFETEFWRNASMFAVAVFAPITGFVFGWWRKWSWTKTNGSEEQFDHVRAQFWATLGFVTAFVLSLLLILILLIMLEQDALLPQTLPDAVTFLISGAILVMGVAIGWNTRNRILRNFGMI